MNHEREDVLKPDRSQMASPPRGPVLVETKLLAPFPREIDGWRRSEEVRSVLETSEINQRVLLHQARSKVRSALEEYLAAS